ncbi:unnamed protein product [Sphenostylis stenocarpa]|uniref:Uncharacterized protein n=1 Tax=Sphenostylis stenocarpa TaxID=92480 RepID=A0AA86SKE1_9FABA|nr:unnamed protein product [Sphenostylis stenocarpa]
MQENRCFVSPKSHPIYIEEQKYTDARKGDALLVEATEKRSFKIALNSVGPPVVVNTIKQKFHDGETSMFYAIQRWISYTVGKRLFYLKITENCKAGLVYSVYIDLGEKSGTGSSAHFNLKFIGNDRYGVLCDMDYNFFGSSPYDTRKKSYCVPPLAETELVCYTWRETGDASCFTLEKKRGESEVVERVKAAHNFAVGHETVDVTVEIRKDRRGGLSVEVEGPLKLTVEHADRVWGEIKEKMESKMVESEIWFHRFASGVPPPTSDDSGRISISIDRLALTYYPTGSNTQLLQTPR